MTRRLILFDVDGTLIRRGDPAHLAAIDHALHRVLPTTRHVSIDQIDFDGKVDRQLFGLLLERAGLGPTVPEAMLQALFDAAVDAYRVIWGDRHGDDDLLPGVRELLTRLRGDERVALGVLTGGLRGVVERKLHRLGLADCLPVGAFGDEVERRPALLPLAVSRAAAHYGVPFPPSRVVVVGDTPLDVDCAHSGGAAAVGVATGRFTVTELRGAGADTALENLAETDRVVATLLTVATAGSPVEAQAKGCP
ncbi:MAG TPA: HAD family hydrolase [Thermomicrobiaceae bacterium]|nr:HAD family hydrolase [Thermomicrobiaceae bacterium]